MYTLEENLVVNEVHGGGGGGRGVGGVHVFLASVYVCTVGAPASIWTPFTPAESFFSE